MEDTYLYTRLRLNCYHAYNKFIFFLNISKIKRLSYIAVVIFKKENNVDVFRYIRDSLGIMYDWSVRKLQ